MKLTDAECLRPTRGRKREKRADGGGLRLVCSAGGARAWELAYRFEGASRTLPLGAYPAVTIDAARQLAGEARVKAERGEDPGRKTQRAVRAQAAVEKARRLDVVAGEWFRTQVVSRREPKYAARVWSRVEADLISALGHMDVGAVEAADVLRALRAVEARGAVYSARTIGRYALGIFRYARIEHGVKHNPAEGLGDALLPAPATVGQPRLAPGEVPEFMVALNRPHADEEVTRLALRLVMHTVLRSNELRGGRWSEIAGDVWNIEPQRMKMKRPHAAPLSRQAAALIERLRSLTGRGLLMFPGRRPGHCLTENGLLFCVYGLGFKGRASVHGWRATFSTWAHDSGRWPSEWIEACLAHIDKNAVRRAYNDAEFLRQRREIMQAWSDWLDAQEAAGLARDADLSALLA